MQKIIVTDKETLDMLEKESTLVLEGSGDVPMEYLNKLQQWVEKQSPFIKDAMFYLISGKTMNDIYKYTGGNRYKDDDMLLCIRMSTLLKPARVVPNIGQLKGRWFDEILKENTQNEPVEYTYRYSWIEQYKCHLDIKCKSEEESRKIAMDVLQSGKYDKKFLNVTDFGLEDVFECPTTV